MEWPAFRRHWTSPTAALQVVLVEREPSIGGKMAGLSETFPTLDCSQCILTPRMVDVAQHPNITLYTYSEVESVEGYVGNFRVTIRKKARYVDIDRCTGCGECWNRLPVEEDAQRIRLRTWEPHGHLRALSASRPSAAGHRPGGVPATSRRERLWPVPEEVPGGSDRLRRSRSTG